MTGILRVPRLAALAAIAALIVAASAASFAESYRGLWLWARHHGLSGVWAAAFPAQVDVFIAVGELALFVGLVDRWDRRSRSGAWGVTLLGLAVSVVGNVGHVVGNDLASRLTAAVPPLAAAAALAVGLGVLKRVVRGHDETASEAGAQPGPVADKQADAEPATPTPREQSRRRPGKGDTAAAVKRLRNRHPDMGTADIARRLGVSDRTVRRHVAAASNGHGPAV